jgi:hypothetical protein
MTCSVGTASDSGTLVFYVHNNTIRATTVGEHGEKSPAIIDAGSDKMKSALLATGVVQALAALVAVDADTAVNGVGAGLGYYVDNLMEVFRGHLDEVGVHQNNDGDNGAFFGTGSDVRAILPGTVRDLNNVKRSITQHFQNDKDGSGSNSATNKYHDVSGVVIDQENLPIAENASENDPLSCVKLLADLHRCHESHRVDLDYHDAADSVNVAAVLPKLPAVHKAVFVELAKNDPTPPATENDGEVVLVNHGGMQRG